MLIIGILGLFTRPILTKYYFWVCTNSNLPLKCSLKNISTVNSQLFWVVQKPQMTDSADDPRNDQKWTKPNT